MRLKFVCGCGIIYAMDKILDNLNEEQLKPVTDTEGQVLVLAGAGSGKTRVLTSRIAYILGKELSSPSGILAITFTNKAAGEMRERLEKMLGDTEGMWICTIHSMCVRILRKYGESVGIRENFSIYSETERNNVIKKIIRELDLNDDKLLKSARYHIANAKNAGLYPDEYGARFKDLPEIDNIVTIYEKYDERLAANNSLDFDDLLLKTLRLLRRDEEARGFLADRFKYILVDEFQDTNTVQYDIIKLLASGHGNLFAVGDDDQSIYGWRGAQIKNILQFDRDYPDAKVYKLQRNYRSSGSILALANEIIKNNGARRDKTLWTDRGDGEKPVYFQAEEEAGEALYAAKVIAQGVRSGAKFSDFAVLMRINALTRAYEQEFTKYGIPYKVFGGFKFFERKEVKDVLAYMRIISNPFDDEAFTRVINVPRRGIGDRTVEILEEYARNEDTSLYYAALSGEGLPLPAATKNKISQFANLIKSMVIDAQSESVADLVRDIISKTDLRSAYEDGTDEGDAKLANLDEFTASVDDFVRLNPGAALDEYLNQITLASDTDDMGDGEYVTLATIHSVKGLEFGQVIICGLEDGIMPTSRAADSPADLEEERRLMYVAVTRAENRLYLTRSKSRYLYGRREPTRPSRFIAEAAAVLDIAPGSEFRSEGLGRPRYGFDYDARRNDYGKPYGNPYGSGYGSKQPKKSEEEDFGYRSDLPPKRGNTASPAGSYGGYRKKESACKYSVGMVVEHKKYGLGTVYSVSGGGAVIQVGFAGKGVIELSAAFAPLKIISRN